MREPALWRWLLGLLLVPVFAGAQESAVPPATTGATSAPPLVEIHLGSTPEGILLSASVAREGLPPATSALSFRVVDPAAHAPGLVPLYAVEVRGQGQLRRHPARGQESSTEPLGWILPLEDEPEAGRLAGRWDLQATQPHGSKAWFAWELAVDGERVSGRFDPFTDSRFAHLTGGSWSNGVLTLRAEYLQARYELLGGWSANTLTGRWQRLDEAESGTWVATRRADVEAALPGGSAALWEWRGTHGFRYTLGTAAHPGAGWERSARALGRVWPVSGNTTNASLHGPGG